MEEVQRGRNEGKTKKVFHRFVRRVKTRRNVHCKWSI